MAGGRVDALYREGDSPLHRMPAHPKILAAFLFVFAVVATPREAMWAFGIDAALLLAAAAVARLGAGFVMRRMLIEIPFIVVAVSLPFFAGGASVDIGGIGLSVEGLWDMWNIVIKATLGLLTSVVLAGTTRVPDLLRGLDTLRMPRIITAIMGFMVRYVDVVVGEFSRTRVAMVSRGYDPHWIGQIGPLARSVGRLFVRSYERGERVYLAMASRGYGGRMPVVDTEVVAPTSWLIAISVPLVAWTLATATLVGSR